MRKLVPLLLLCFSSCLIDKDVDLSKYPIVTTARELTEFYDLNLDLSGEFEKTITTRYFDGAKELEYTYELLETEDFDPLFYSVTISRDPTVRDAKQSFSILKGIVSVISKAIGESSIKIDSLELPGEENYYAIRTYEGEPNGLFLIIRDGKYVYDVMCSGIHTEDHSLVLDLLLPEIENLTEFEIIK